MAKIGFEFPLDESQQWDGFNDSGIEHFSGSPFRSLGREGTQNTTDAAKKGVPAIIRVRRINISTSEIPNVSELRSAMKACHAASVDEAEKAKQFFENAISILSKPKISILQFADINTLGVAGPCENGSPYFALMKASGQSKKQTGTASGSFGIGKFAPFTVSGLRTIFLTTVWQDADKQLQHYVQGKSILMSHRATKKTYRGTGFWGERKNCLPVIGKVETLPIWLRRDMSSPQSTGTTLHILGFSPPKDWQKILAGSIAESFFAAISRGHLQVEIEDGPVLNEASVLDIFQDASVTDAIQDQKDEPETFKNSAHFLNALQSNESKIEETENAGLGHCRLHILVGENLPKRVAVLRNGMLITSELERLRRFGDFKEFAAVLECLSDRGNALLRAMEPPAHDAFEPSRLISVDQQRVGRVALREIAEWVREMLKRHAQDPVSEVTEIDELAEFFGDDETNDSSSSRDGDENPRGSIKIRARPLPPRKPSIASDNVGNGLAEDGDGTGDGQDGSGDDDDGDGGGDYGGAKNDSDGGDKGSAGGGGGGKAAPSPTLSLRNVRAIVVGPNQRRISFTPDISGEIRIELEDSGADTNRLLRITKVSQGMLAEGRVKVSCVSGLRVAIDVDIDRNFDGTIRMKANAV
jgi:hypothetical protein